MKTERQSQVGAHVPTGAHKSHAQEANVQEAHAQESDIREPHAHESHAHARGVLRRAWDKLRVENATDEVRLLRVVLALALVGGFALSRKLWVSSGRSFPVAPVFDFLPGVPSPFDYVWLGALVVLLLLVAASARPRGYACAFLALAVGLALLDETRWQPWFYQYLFMLFALAVCSKGVEGEEKVLRACALIVASLYFWGGAQKLNPQFFSEVVPSLAVELLPRLPASFARLTTPLGALIPLTEICAGLLLLTRRWRRVGMLLALLIHVSVLMLFFPSRRNKVVWPWNAAMIVFVLILFRRGSVAGLRDFLPRRALSLQALVAVVFGLMPLLSFFGLWGRYLSGALYSGNTGRAEVRLSYAVAQHLPPKVQQKLTPNGDGASLDINHWSYVELKVPAYPSERVYRRAAARLCEFAERPTDVWLLMREGPRLFGGEPALTSLDCDALTRPTR
ncbi:MAG: hypothetical protein QOE46_2302 [Acidobacteriota bacterium]|jgi:hypothetical protein|nr:hypothetical protein [Acidobacteriota bacterium]